MGGDREFDIIIFGASGVAGKYCVEQLHKYGQSDNLRWAVAGRNENKLIDILHEVSSWLSADLVNAKLPVPRIIADVKDPESLTAMARRTRCIINTVGPYTRWGEPVIQACLDANTHLLDLSGELCYNEGMRNKYHSIALEKGVIILAPAGYDSVPMEMLLQYTKQKFPGKVNCLETFATFTKGELGSAVNTGTWESVLEIMSFSAFNKMPHIREAAWSAVFGQTWEPMEFRTRRPLMIGRRKHVPGYTLPFIGGDKPAASHSEFFRRMVDPSYKRTQVQTYLYVPTFLETMAVIIIMMFAAVLCQVSWGKRLLTDYPSFFTAGFFRKGGPTREQVLSCGFTMYGIATGWHRGDRQSSAPERQMVIRLDGPEVGYMATSICLVNSAICVIKETDKIPLRGGYLTPGFALENTSLLERLLATDKFKFTIENDLQE